RRPRHPADHAHRRLVQLRQPGGGRAGGGTLKPAGVHRQRVAIPRRTFGTVLVRLTWRATVLPAVTGTVVTVLLAALVWNWVVEDTTVALSPVPTGPLPGSTHSVMVRLSAGGLALIGVAETQSALKEQV